MLTPDSSLINATEQGGMAGTPLILSFLQNLVPRIFAPNKSSYSLGNYYAQKIGGVISEDDLTTGISFSPVSESYHLLGWAGVLVLLPVLLFSLFIIADSLCGRVDQAPWGLIYVALFGHIAPEGGILGSLYLDTYVAFGIISLAVLSGIVLPAIIEWFLPPSARAKLG